MTQALVIGAGPAGLMAADVLSAAGAAVTIVDRMPSPGRKFLMAGKSGLNLTKIEDPAAFRAAYGTVQPALAAALDAFGPDQVIDWAKALGQEVFTGSTGRVFPVAMKASPLMRAWLARLDRQGARLLLRHRWTGWDDAGAARFDTPDGEVRIAADVTVLALGGASWARLGSDGAWSDVIGAGIAPFRPANMGFDVPWTAHMADHFGQPVKGCRLIAGQVSSRGEFVVTPRGIEGGGVYAVSAAVRDSADLLLDLAPDLTEDALRQKLAKPQGKRSLSNHIRRTLGFDPVRLALLNEFGRPFPPDLAPLIKNLPVPHTGPRPLDEAISTAGGLRFDEIGPDLALKNRPDVFCAGEMLDWEAPTGGYLLTACLALGRLAGAEAVEKLGLGR